MKRAVAFEDIKVVEVTQVAAVPMSTRHLADFSADVLHVESTLAVIGRERD